MIRLIRNIRPSKNLFKSTVNQIVNSIKLSGFQIAPFIKFESTMSKPVETGISEALQALEPVHLSIQNESYMHNVPKESETHFKVLIVTSKFEGEKLIKRHRTVNQLVKEKLQELFPHALSIEAKTPTEWDSNYKIP